MDALNARFHLSLALAAAALASLAVAGQHETLLRRYVPITAYEDYSDAVSVDANRRYTYMDVEDTHISAATPDLNFGHSPQLVISDGARDRILIAFEQLYRALTVGSEVTDVELILVPAADLDLDAVVELHRVLLPWRDGGGTGTRLVGAVTYNDRFAAEPRFRRAWTTPGGDADRAEQPSLRGRLRDFFDADTGRLVLSGPGLVDDVKLWRGRHYRNYGWAISIADAPTTEEGKARPPLAFHSSDVLEEAHRPALRVVYVDKPLVKPALPDLDVTFIERTPRYYRYNDNGRTSYVRQDFHGDTPGIMLHPDYERYQKHPEPGDLVVFIAHIKNASDVPFSGPLTYHWRINERVVKQRASNAAGTEDGVTAEPVTVTIAPWDEITTRLEWEWDVDLADPRKVVLEFEVDPEGAIAEITENNNALTKYVAGRTLKYWVERSVYEYVKDYVSCWGSYSFEDYLQWHVDVWNETYFCKSRFDDFAPDGGLPRVTLDDFEIVPDGVLQGGIHRPEDELDPRFDGEWGTTWAKVREPDKTDEQLRDYYWFLQRHRVVLEPSLLHECSHQVWGAYDIYWSNIEPSEPTKPVGKCKITDETGNYITRGGFYVFTGLMGGGDTRPTPEYSQGTGLYAANSIGGANANTPFRNGFFGEWQYDLPEKCFLKITSRDGVPLAGAKVSAWQQTWKGILDENLVFEDLAVDSDGILLLPDQDSLESEDRTTVTGHTLRKANPWGRIDVVGQNVTLMLRVDYQNQRDYQLVRVTSFNRAFWMGHHDQWTHPLPCRISPAPDIDLNTNVAVGATVRASQESADAALLVDDQVETHWRSRGANAGDYIEIVLAQPRNVGIVRLVQDGANPADFFGRFVITTKPDASPGTPSQPFDEQGPIRFNYAMSFEKDVSPTRPSERWVTYAATPRTAQVIRIEAVEPGPTDLSEVRVFAR